MNEFETLTLEEQKKYLESLHAFDLKELYQSLDETNQDQLFDLLNDEQKASLLAYLEPDEAADIIEDLKVEDYIPILNEMEPDDAADIINELESDNQAKTIEALEPELKEDIIALREYEDFETGSIMTTQFITLNPEMEIKDAMKKMIAEAPEVESINTLFVVDKNETFLGVVPLKKMIKAKSPCLIESLYEKSEFALDIDDKEETVTRIQELSISVLPVLNEDNTLVGMVTVDDAIDTYEEEMIEDLQKLAALGDETSDSTLANAVKRLPWLVVLLLLALPIAGLTSSFESILKSYTIIVILQPLILSLMGNAGTQTLTFSLIMLADDEPNHIIQENIKKELFSAFLSGIVLSLISMIIAMTFIYLNPALDENPWLFGFIVGLSVWLSILAATLFSSVVPVLIKKIGLDPASASGPLITTMVDISTILIYYGVASIMIGALL